MYGGAAKGGKSHAFRYEAHNQCLENPGIRGLLIRSQMPELKRTHIARLPFDLPPGSFKYNQTDHIVFYPNNSVLEFGYGSSLKDIIRYLSAEYAFIMIDELTTIPFELALLLMSRLAAPESCPDYIPFFAGATNPGSVAHNEVKSYFVDKDFDKEYPELATEYYPENIAFVPATIYDNPILLKRDPGILRRFEQLSPMDRKRFLEGDWDIFEGQFFERFSRDVHEIDGIEIGRDWPAIGGMDYGNNTVAYKIVQEPRNKDFIVVWEWREYKKEDSDLARSCWNHLTKHGDRDLLIRCDNNMKAKGINQKITAFDVFRAKGIRLVPVSKTKIDTVGFREGCNARVKDLLNWQMSEGGLFTKKPKLYFMKGRCPYLMKTLPKLQVDKNNDRDIDQDNDIDHGYDALKMGIVSFGLPVDKKEMVEAAKKAMREWAKQAEQVA